MHDISDPYCWKFASFKTDLVNKFSEGAVGRKLVWLAKFERE